MSQIQTDNVNKIKMLERLSDGVWEWDIINKDMYFSNSLKENLGYYSDEIINEPNRLKKLIHPDDFEYVKATIENHYSQRYCHFELEYRLLTKRGNYRSFLVGGEINYNSDHQPIHILAIHKDITEKKQIEKRLEKTERFYTSIFYKSKAVMLMIDSETIHICDANEEACKFYGYSKEILTAMSIREIEIIPQDNKRQEIISEFKKVLKKGYGVVILKHRLSNGKERDVKVYISPIEIDGKVYFHCIINDITKEIKMKRLLKESERKYKKLFNSASEGVFLVGLTEDGYPYKILDVNKSACKDFGYTRDELLNMTFEDLESHEGCGQALQRVKHFFKKKYSRFGVNIQAKDGTNIPVEFTTHLFKLDGQDVVLGVSRDMTEEILAQKAILESEETYKTMIKSFPDAAFVHYNEIIEYTNDKGAKLLGYGNSEDIIKKPVWEVIPQNDVKRAKNNLSKAIEEKTNPPLMEQKIIKKDGSIIDVEMSSTIVNYNGNEAIFTSMRDITERKKTENKLKRAMEENKKLLEATVEHEKVKNDFFANMSHELKTPLNIIFGSIQLINSVNNEQIGECQECTRYNTFNKYINMMKQNSYRLLRLVNNLIDISKIDAKHLNLKLKNYNIISVVEEITMSVADYLQNKGIDLIFDTETEEKIIACDVDKVERIMLNILSNAIKYTDVGGNIFVNIQDKEERIIISIKDTGIGIPKERLQDIFERFRQVDSLLTRKREGSGIGLSLVIALVKAHGGNITVESELGKGSEFIIELPITTIDDPNIYDEVDSSNDEKVERINIEFADIYS